MCGLNHKQIQNCLPNTDYRNFEHPCEMARAMEIVKQQVKEFALVVPCYRTILFMLLCGVS